MTSAPLRPVRLDPDAFAPFGSVVAAGLGPGIPVNQGRAERFDLACGLDHDARASRLVLATYRVTASAAPLAVELLERHPFSDQLFAPMTAESYLVVVAPDRPDGGPDADAARAFLAPGDRGVVYRAGVWHYPIAALGCAADFLMCMRETGAGDDTEVVALGRPLPVAL
jgi:ureidoglycolate lyase